MTDVKKEEIEELKLTFEERDEYKRKEVAEKVIHLLKSDVKVSPLVIDGTWGCGKTEFTEKLISLIDANKDKPFDTIYIDAFKEDHTDEPLMTIMAAVLEKLPKDKSKKLMKLALPVISFGMKTGGKALVSWILRQDSVALGEEYEKTISKGSGKAIDFSVESLLKEHQQSKANIKNLTNALTNLVKDSELVIFIDELDRCRPDFAVQILENIKHIFDVKGLQFVLVTNTEQLIASINHCYGIGVDAKRYLDKFLGFSFLLPDVFYDGNKQVKASIKHFESLLQNSTLQTTVLGMGGYADCFEIIINNNNLSLREVETFILYLEIFNVIDSKSLGNSVASGKTVLYILGVFIFCFKPEITKQLCNNVIDAKALLKLIGATEIIDINSEASPNQIETIAALIYIESNVDIHNILVSKPFIDQETLKKWNSKFIKIAGHNYPRREKIIKLMINAINILKLGKNKI